MNAADEQTLGLLDLDELEFCRDDLRELGLTPSRETSVNPGGSGVMMPCEPPGVRRDDSITTIFNSLTTPPAAPAPASGAPMDSHAQCFNALRLAIQSHSVHKVENENTEDREYVVSNLRTFNIEVQLVDSSGELAVDVNVGLQTSLLYENGLDVQRPNDLEQMLTGETEVVIIGGRGVFKLKMGASVLSSKMGKQRFRVKIAPKSDQLRAAYPQLTVLTEPLKYSPPPRSPLGQPAAETAAAAPSGGILGEGMEARLRAELMSERTERSAMEEKLRAQREQIAELAKSNAHILEELRQIKNNMHPAGAGGIPPGGGAKRR